MSYDPKKTRDLLQISGAHDNNPAAEYIRELCVQLKAAEEAIEVERQNTRKAEGNAARYATEAEAAQQTILRMKEERPVAPVEAPKAKRTRAKKAAATEGVTV